MVIYIKARKTVYGDNGKDPLWINGNIYKVTKRGTIDESGTLNKTLTPYIVRMAYFEKNYIFKIVKPFKLYTEVCR